MSWQKVTSLVRPGSLSTIHRISHLSHNPPVRTFSCASFACNRNTYDHHRRRDRIGIPATTLTNICSNLPLKSNLGSQPHRAASTTGGASTAGGATGAATVGGATGAATAGGATGASTASGATDAVTAGGGATPGWYESITDSAPVHLTEQLLISIHQTTGLPWWASILGTTLALRTVITLPLGVYQMVIISKVEALQVEIAELAKRLRYEVSVRAQEQGWTERVCRYQFKKNLRRIVSELYVRDNCHPFKASILVWVQIPMWVCLSLALRNMSLGTSQASLVLQSELSVGGALWFPDLTLPDSTWILPISLGLLNLLLVEIFALRTTAVTTFQKYVTNFIRGISLLMIPIAATVPSSMALYWFGSSCVGLAHNLLLRSPRFRRLCRVPPSLSDSAMPYRDIATAFKAKYLKYFLK